MVLRRSFLWLFVVVLVVTGSVSAQAPAEDLAWEQIAPGIEYQKFRLPDPNNIFVVRMDRANPTVTLETTIAQGKLAEGRETVSGMYARYDQALNYWGGSANPPTWGMRNQAVVAINGSYIVPGIRISPRAGRSSRGGMPSVMKIRAVGVALPGSWTAAYYSVNVFITSLKSRSSPTLRPISRRFPVSTGPVEITSS